MGSVSHTQNPHVLIRQSTRTKNLLPSGFQATDEELCHPSYASMTSELKKDQPLPITTNIFNVRRGEILDEHDCKNGKPLLLFLLLLLLLLPTGGCLAEGTQQVVGFKSMLCEMKYKALPTARRLVAKLLFAPSFVLSSWHWVIAIYHYDFGNRFVRYTLPSESTQVMVAKRNGEGNSTLLPYSLSLSLFLSSLRLLEPPAPNLKSQTSWCTIRTVRYSQMTWYLSTTVVVWPDMLGTHLRWHPSILWFLPHRLSIVPWLYTSYLIWLKIIIIIGARMKESTCLRPQISQGPQVEQP